jgi:hypothetical protein
VHVATKRGAGKPKNLFDIVVKAAEGLPAVEISTCFGTPALRVKGKFLARFREDGESLVIKVLTVERDHMIAHDPRVFFTEDHYRNYPSVLIHLSKVKPAVLRELIGQAWRRAAPKRLVAVYDAAGK